jgi:hypothetical protein
MLQLLDQPKDAVHFFAHVMSVDAMLQCNFFYLDCLAMLQTHGIVAYSTCNAPDVRHTVLTITLPFFSSLRSTQPCQNCITLKNYTRKMVGGCVTTTACLLNSTPGLMCSSQLVQHPNNTVPTQQTHAQPRNWSRQITHNV